MTGQVLGGKVILRRPLTPAERGSISDRVNALTAWLTPTERNKAMQAVVAMLMGFPGAVPDRKEGVAKAAVYVAALRDEPLWAVQRACERFSMGQVTREEAGGDVNPAFAPSTAQLAKVVAAVAKPVRDERSTLVRVLGGMPEPPDLTPEQREEMASRLGQVAAELRNRQEGEAASSLNEARAKQSERSMRLLEAEYQAAGVEVPAGELVSLSLRRALGWRTEEVDGKMVLVSPPAMRR